MVKVHKLPDQQNWQRWRWTLMGLIITALSLSILLSWHYLKEGSMVACGGRDGACDQVLNSRWSLVAGILPVSSLAVGAYFAVMVSSFFIEPSTDGSIRKIAWSVLLVLGGCITGSAVWFFILQKWIIGEFCKYCIATHITGILFTSLIIWRYTTEIYFSNFNANTIETEEDDRVLTPKRLIGWQRTALFVFVGLFLAGLLAATQIGFSSTTVHNQGKTKDNHITIDFRNVPLIGSPGASNIIVLLFDYQCPHCQKLHLLLKDVASGYNGKLAFALCPIPLNHQCNPYINGDADEFKNSCELARIGLAVWLARRSAFEQFENWMFTFDTGSRWQPRNLADVKQKAAELTGGKELEAALINPWIDQYMQTCINIYGQTINGGTGGVPKLIYGSRWVTPEANSAEELIDELHKSLKLPKL